MKPELQRIEAALQAAAKHATIAPPPSNGTELWDTAIAAYTPHSHTAAEAGEAATGDQDQSPAIYALLNSGAVSQVEQRLELPEFARANDHHPFVALTNSALAVNLLQDLQTQVRTWAAKLENLLQQIQSVYEEGPLVDGWLESVASAQPTATGYRLCGLSEDGQMWSRNCPPAQVPDVSLAIVRYQRLQALLHQKHRLETQLGRLTEALVELHSQSSGAHEGG